MQCCQRMCCCFAAISKNFAIKRCVMSHGRLLSVKLLSLNSANREPRMSPSGRAESQDFRLVLSTDSSSLFSPPLPGYIFLVNYLYNIIVWGHQLSYLVFPLHTFFLYLELGMHSIRHNWSQCNIHTFLFQFENKNTERLHYLQIKHLYTFKKHEFLYFPSTTILGRELVV